VKLFFLSVLGFLQFGSQVIRYALIFASAFLRQRASLAFELVAIRSQLTFYKERIRQKKQSRPLYPGFSSPLGMAVNRVEWMEVGRQSDEIKDGSQVA
jgi:hypothetical protein